jgi:hypothetical protein
MRVSAPIASFLDLAELALADDVELPARELRARRTFWPRRPMASDSLSSGTTSSMPLFASSMMTRDTSAGAMALQTKRAGSRSHGTMSIFSPRSSCTTACTARALHADAGADRVDVGVAARHGDLGARTGLAGSGDDAHDALVDLRHFHLEQLHEQAHVRARQDDLRAARLAIDVEQERHHAVARAVALTRRLLARGSTASVRPRSTTMLLPRSKRRTMPVTISPRRSLNSLKMMSRSASRNALDDDLLGGLRGDAAESPGAASELEQIAELAVLLAGALGVFLQVEDLEAELFAELGVEAVALGVDRADLALGVLDASRRRSCTGRGRPRRCPRCTGLELAVDPERALGGGQDRLLHRLDQDLGVDALLLADLVDDAQQRKCALLHGCSPLERAMSAQSFKRGSEAVDQVRLRKCREVESTAHALAPGAATPRRAEKAEQEAREVLACLNGRAVLTMHLTAGVALEVARLHQRDARCRRS